jgi:pyruvate dehydrogenase E2 component (dihydrolipoamide acetyltransferase)
VAVETDKVDMEVEAFESGYLRELLAEEGSMASALAPVAILTDTPEEKYARPGEESAKPVPPARALNAAPAARALAKELKIDLTQVEGSGPKGLITRADVQRFAEGRTQAAAPAPNRALSAMAATVANSKRDIPHFYATRDLEVTSAARWRDRWNEAHAGVHASFNDVFVRCAALALGDVPRLNVAYKDGAFAERAAADVLLVVAREPALVLLPVADPRALDWKDLIQRVRDSAAQGNSAPAAPLLAISNLGMYGVKEFAAIIPPGCSSVLAIGAVRDVAVVRDGAVTVGTIATVTLSADHRVIDGIAAARFLERMQFHLNSL